jgi:predicted DNA-binding transcriptional regulator AlpA
MPTTEEAEGRRPRAPKKHHLDRRAAAIAVQDTGADDQLLNTRELAKWLGVSTQFLEIGRHKGYGPRYTRLSPRNIRYKRSDVLAWLATRVPEYSV